MEGKVALVTGGARGIGGATATLLAEAGAKVVVTDLLEPDGQALVEKINQAGGTTALLRHDVTNESEWERVVATTVHQHGGLDILVNNPKAVVATSTTAINANRLDNRTPVGCCMLKSNANHKISAGGNVGSKAE